MNGGARIENLHVIGDGYDVLTACPYDLEV